MKVGAGGRQLLSRSLRIYDGWRPVVNKVEIEPSGLWSRTNWDDVVRMEFIERSLPGSAVCLMARGRAPDLGKPTFPETFPTEIPETRL